MNITPNEIVAVLARATLALGASALVVEGFFRWIRPRSLTLQRAAWALVLLQGVLWFHVPLEATCPTWLLAPPEVETASPSPITDEWTVDLVAQSSPTADSLALDATGDGATTASWRDWAGGAVTTWLAGIAVLLGLGVAAFGRVLVRLTRSRPAQPDWAEEWKTLLTALGIHRNIPLCVSEKIGPALCWTPRGYRMVVPTALWSSLASAQRIAILRHELAHFRRADLWKNLLSRLVMLPQWFNPAAWWAARRFALLAEWACDREAAGREPAGAVEYARTLLRVGAGRDCFSPCAATARAGSLAERIRQLLLVPSLEDTTMKKVAVACVVLALVGLNVFQVELVARESEGMTPDVSVGKGTTPGAPVADAKKTEWNAQRLGPYKIEPPDVLAIELNNLVPRELYRTSTFDVLQISAIGTLSESPVNGFYLVEAEGTVSLGPAYGSVKVLGMTLDEAQKAVRKKLLETVVDPKVTVQLGRAVGLDQVTGNYLVGPDGTVNLRRYGSVHVSGKTIQQAAQAVETQLKKRLRDPKISIDVATYNSKVYYIITEGGPGQGDSVVRVPFTGNDTVLDALAKVQGVVKFSDKTIWLARPTPGGQGKEQILPVDWRALTRGANTATNHQLLPGDRLFLSDKAPDEAGKASNNLPPHGQD